MAKLRDHILVTGKERSEIALGKNPTGSGAWERGNEKEEAECRKGSLGGGEAITQSWGPGRKKCARRSGQEQLRQSKEKMQRGQKRPHSAIAQRGNGSATKAKKKRPLDPE